MYDNWTKCTECQFFDPEKYYCKKLLHTVTIGCPYGEPKHETHYDAIVHMPPEGMAVFLAEITATRCNGKPETRRMKILEWLMEAIE